MAHIHRATLAPGKLELLTGWLPSRPWCAGVEGLRQLGAYRFDDPAGEVGMESLLVQAGDGPVHSRSGRVPRSRSCRGSTPKGGAHHICMRTVTAQVSCSPG